MTIYTPEIRELPRDEMSRLCPEATFSVVEVDGMVLAYVYEWADLEITINVLPRSDLSAHLDGFIGWCQSVASSHGQALDKSLTERIRSTTIVLGFVVKKATERDVWHERVQDLIAMICYNTRSLLFWEGAIFDEECRQLLPVPA
jgi:hypothetical protein